MQTIAGQRVPLDFVVNWMVANLYFVRESITDSPESWWYLTVPNSDSETDYVFRDEEDRFEQFSKNRPLVRGENLILSICYSLFRDFEIEISLPTRERERKRKEKKYALLNFPLTEQSRETNIGGHFYLPLSGINTTFPCYRSYEIGLEIGGGIQGRRNAKFAPGERREGWW